MLYICLKTVHALQSVTRCKAIMHSLYQGIFYHTKCGDISPPALVLAPPAVCNCYVPHQRFAFFSYSPLHTCNIRPRH